MWFVTALLSHGFVTGIFNISLGKMCSIRIPDWKLTTWERSKTVHGTLKNRLGRRGFREGAHKSGSGSRFLEDIPGATFMTDNKNIGPDINTESDNSNSHEPQFSEFQEWSLLSVTVLRGQSWIQRRQDRQAFLREVKLYITMPFSPSPPPTGMVTRAQRLQTLLQQE